MDGEYRKQALGMEIEVLFDNSDFVTIAFRIEVGTGNEF